MGLFNIDRNGCLANPQVLFLIVALAIGVGVIVFAGGILTPLVVQAPHIISERAVFAGGILTPLIISPVIARILDGGIGLPQFRDRKVF